MGLTCYGFSLPYFNIPLSMDITELVQLAAMQLYKSETVFMQQSVQTLDF